MLENLIGSMLADKSINGEPMSVNSGWVSEFMSTFSEVSQTSKSNFMGPADSLYSLCEPFFFAFHNEQKKICFQLEEENVKLKKENQKLLQCEDENLKLKKENQKLKYKVKKYSEKSPKRSSTTSMPEESNQVQFHTLTMQVKKLAHEINTTTAANPQEVLDKIRVSSQDLLKLFRHHSDTTEQVRRRDPHFLLSRTAESSSINNVLNDSTFVPETPDKSNTDEKEVTSPGDGVCCIPETVPIESLSLRVDLAADVKSSKPLETRAFLQTEFLQNRQIIKPKTNLFNKKEVFKPQEEEDGVLSDSSDPDETQIVSYDGVCCIPETVPFDVYVPQNGGTLLNTNTFFKADTTPFSPVLGSGLDRKPIQPQCVTPKSVTPAKTVKIENADEALDQSYYSPTVFDLIGQPEQAQHLQGPHSSITAKVPDHTDEEEEEDFPQHAKKNLFRKDRTVKTKDDVPKPSSRPIQPTPIAKKTKPMKQTKLTSTLFQNDFGQNENHRGMNRDQLRTQVATKKDSTPPRQPTEAKRRRRGKDPESWDCKNCYRLFREAEMSGKLDVRKMPVTMNFCDEHFNRFTYYLNTPPDFWNPRIVGEPRNGHLHPLDASATQNLEDNF